MIGDVRVERDERKGHRAGRRARLIGGLALALGGSLASPGGAVADTTVLASAAAITILDAAAASPYPSTITAAGVPGTVSRVSVTLRGLSHTRPENLDIILVGPGGQKVLLMSDVGRSDDVTNATITLDDAGPPLPTRRLGSGTFKPTSRKDKDGGDDVFPAPAPAGPYAATLAAFNGTNPNGDWRLFVRDDRSPDVGLIAGGWCLALTTGPGGVTGGCSPSLTVVKVGPGTVTSAPPGIACGSDCQESYAAGTVVTLSAAAAPGFVFQGWSGGVCAGTDPCAVTVTQAVTVTATFAPPPGTFTLTVTTAGSGTVTSVPTGIACGLDCSEAYPAGTGVTLTAVPDPSFVFIGWVGGGCSGTDPCVVTMDQDRAVGATFAAPAAAFALAVTTVGGGTVTSAPPGIDCGSDCAEAYPGGTVVTLTASPAPSFVFSGWVGGGCSGTDPCVVTMDQDRVVTATFAAPPGAFALAVAIEGSGTVSSAPVGISCAPDCAETYPADAEVTLTASPGPSFVFGGWSGGGCTGTDPCLVVMDQDQEVTALFVAPPGSFTLTVTTTGTGTVSSVPGGISCGGDCAEAYVAGTAVTLTATPGASFVFAGWSGGGCTGTDACVVTMTADLSLSATFVAAPGSFALAVLPGGSGVGTVTSEPAGIDCGSDCAQAYAGGTAVTLTATPGASFVFAGWSGGGCTGTGACVVTMTADVTVSATFQAPAGSFTLTVLNGGPGVGTVTSAPAGIDCGSDCQEAYPAGTAVTLTATPAPSFAFAGWSGGGCSGTDPCTVSMDSSLTVSATFTAPPGAFALRVTRGGLGLGRVTSAPAGIACGQDCAEAYAASTAVTLSARGRRGSVFTGWSGGGCDGANPCVLTVAADTLLAAGFDPPGDRPLIVGPEEDDVPVNPGDLLTVTWLGVAGATEYGFEYTGPNLPFTNPIGSGPDAVNGFGGLGGGFAVPGTSITVQIPPDLAPGVYQVRIVGLTPASLVGRMSDAVTFLVGGIPGDQPAITTPADGTPVPGGTLLVVAWTPVAGAAQYLITFEGGPDPGLIGGGFLVPVNVISGTVPVGTPSGTYRVRVLGLTAAGAPVGSFSEVLTLEVF